MSARRISKKSSNRGTKSALVAFSIDTASYPACSERLILSAARESLLHCDGSSMSGGRTSNWKVSSRPAFPETRDQIKKARTHGLVGVAMLTLKVFHPFMGDVNPRAGPSCLVDGNCKASQTLKTDARINEGKTGQFTQHQQRRDEIIVYPRIGADVEFGQRPS